jgi:hypothetical protein
MIEIRRVDGGVVRGADAAATAEVSLGTEISSLGAGSYDARIAFKPRHQSWYVLLAGGLVADVVVLPVPLRSSRQNLLLRIRLTHRSYSSPNRRSEDSGCFQGFCMPEEGLEPPTRGL